jgi:hypothetical protein
LATVTFYIVVATRPVSDTIDPSGFANFSLFATAVSVFADQRLFLVVIAAGELGRSHTITSFADFIGNRSLAIN